MAPLDYGPVLLRKPFGSRLAADTLPSGCPRGQNATVGASPWLCPSFPTSCPCRVRHGRAPQPTRHYPRLWIHRPSSGRPRDLNPPDQNAAQHTLWRPPTPDRGGHGYGFPPPVGPTPCLGVRPPDRVSQVPRFICRRPPSPTTPESPTAASARCFAAGVRLHLIWEVGHSHLRIEAETGSRSRHYG